MSEVLTDAWQLIGEKNLIPDNTGVLSHDGAYLRSNLMGKPSPKYYIPPLQHLREYELWGIKWVILGE